MQNNYIFVYGTLRRACAIGAHRTYLAGADFIGNAKVRGNLYRVSYYPALVLDNAAGPVVGEIYRVSAELLMKLDAYEECTYPSLPTQEYQRKKIKLITDTGATLSVWVYVYQYSVQDCEIISSGDFLKP